VTMPLARSIARPTMRSVLVITILALTLVAIGVWTLFIGAADTTPEIIRDIRAPRMALATIVGAGLGVSGALLQGVLRNPLADPGIVGVSGGAALGAVIAVAIGAAYGSTLSGIGAVIGGIIAMAVVIWIARGREGTEVVTLVLAGVAVTAFTSAILSVFVTASGSAGARTTTFWTTGSIALATWPSVVIVCLSVLAAIIIALTIARRLDVLSLGERAAYAAGVPVAAVRWWALTAAVLAVGAGVAMVGIIVFIGLVVPHAVRMLMGPRHAPLIIASGLGGALLLLVADTIARTLVSPVELPIGVVTAIIGAPIFVLLLRRTRSRQGGWA
jgi:iron complex transport system permease protein